MRLFFSYVKSHTFPFVAYLLCYGIAGGVFALYGLPPEPVLYAAVLSACVLSVVGAVRYSRFRRHCQTLAALAAHITVTMPVLPRARDAAEETYQAMLTDLYHALTASVSAHDRVCTDMREYYTLWAHQIKTPIAAMRLLLQVHEDAALSEQLFKTEQYVDMVLSYARSESMSGDLLLRRYDLDDILRRAVKKFAPIFIHKKIKLVYEPVSLSVLTDEKWLQCAIEQILSNALKYTQEGGTVSITAEAPQALVITDNGIGIRAEDLPRVCERGFTGFNGRADKKSTGLGLFLCKRILTKLSHTLCITSEVGRYTCVKIGLDRYEMPKT